MAVREHRATVPGPVPHQIARTTTIRVTAATGATTQLPARIAGVLTQHRHPATMVAAITTVAANQAIRLRSSSAARMRAALAIVSQAKASLANQATRHRRVVVAHAEVAATQPHRAVVAPRVVAEGVHVVRVNNRS